jgi:AcrR family transcriptional regulator
MPRTRPPQRLADLVEAASAAFVAHGYARTQMDDVAERLGVAKGTVYGYVASKEALFALALAYGDGIEPLPIDVDWPLDVTDLPIPDELVEQRLAGELGDLLLLSAVEAPAADAGRELGEVVADLLRRLGRHRVAIKLVDRCAPELPRLAELWYGGGRWGQVAALARYLESQADAGRLRLPGDAAVVARSIVELCALWAVHLHWDPSPRPVPDAVILETVPRMVRSMVARSGDATTPTPADGRADR